MFGYFAQVAPGGGGTLIVAGSHRLAERQPGLTSRDLRLALAERSPWFRDLWSVRTASGGVDPYFAEGATVDGVEVKVVELTGAPGDLVLWPAHLLHAIAPNARDVPRFMFTHTVARKG